jgi:CHASE3 domain sensor protein
MYFDRWLARRNARDSDRDAIELLSKKRSLRVKISEARRELDLRHNSEEDQLDQMLARLDEQLADEIREVENRITRSFDRKLTRRAV